MWNRQVRNAGNQSDGLANAMQSAETKQGPILHRQQLTTQGKRQVWMLNPSPSLAPSSTARPRIWGNVGDGIYGWERGVTHKGRCVGASVRAASIELLQRGASRRHMETVNRR